MKRISILLMSLFVMVTVNAQHNGFVCTGNNVNVRTGPGKNYAVYDVDYPLCIFWSPFKFAFLPTFMNDFFFFRL